MFAVSSRRGNKRDTFDTKLPPPGNHSAAVRLRFRMIVLREIRQIRFQICGNLLVLRSDYSTQNVPSMP